MTASYVVTLSLLILAIAPSASAGDQRITSAQFDRHYDAATRFQTAVDAYVAQRYQSVEPASEGSFCLPDDVEGEEAWTPYEGAFFFPEIARMIRTGAAAAFRREYKHADPLAALKREALRAPAIRVNETLPQGTGVAPAPWLAAVLPPLPRELTYRQVGLDLVLIDATSDLVIDVLRCAVFLH